MATTADFCFSFIYTSLTLVLNNIYSYFCGGWCYDQAEAKESGMVMDF